MHLALIIDADPACREDLSARLRQEAWCVISTASLEEAADSTGILRPDVVIVDHEPASHRLFRMIPDVPVFIYSPQEILEMKHSDGTGVFRNPFEREQLLRAVLKVCS